MNILITGAWGNAEEHIAEIEALGHKVVFLQNEKSDIPCPCEYIEGIIGNGIFLNHSIDKFSNLKYIQLTSAGFDRLPVEEVERRGIRWHTARGVYSLPMAEFALSGVLQLYKQTRFFIKNQAAHIWQKHRGLLELSGKTVCILGCGSVGTECAIRFAAFGCRVLGIDLAPVQASGFSSVLPLSALYETLPHCDIVVLTLPLTPQTEGMFGEAAFAAMQPGAVLVNLSRGRIVEEAALLPALQTRLLGAVLDVFEEEPLPPEHPFWDIPNLLLSPHNAFVGEGNPSRLWNLILKNLECAENL